MWGVDGREERLEGYNSCNESRSDVTKPPFLVLVVKSDSLKTRKFVVDTSEGFSRKSLLRQMDKSSWRWIKIHLLHLGSIRQTLLLEIFPCRRILVVGFGFLFQET